MKILLCNGRGGSGKSILARALINYLSADPDNKVLVIDADTQLRDVIQTTEGTSRNNITLLPADLHTDDGWDDFINNIEDHSKGIAKDHTLAVVSLPGYTSIIKEGLPFIKNIFDELGCEVFEFFTTARDHDSIKLFELSQQTGFGSISAQTILVKNMIGFNKVFYKQSFELWNESQAKGTYQPVEIVMPDLYWKTANLCRSSTVTMDEVAEKEDVSPMKRQTIKDWTEAMNREFQKLDLIPQGRSV